MRLLIRDSRGKPSWTCTLAVPAIIGITVWFMLGGMDMTVGTVRVAFAVKTAAEYSLAVGVWLAFFAQREWVAKKNGPPAAGGA